MTTVLFGFRSVTDVPPCPCLDPGTHLALEQPDEDEPLRCHLRCWCGATMVVTFDDLDERAAFIDKHTDESECT